jgi:hypothetical protein
MGFEQEFEKFFETHVMGRHEEFIKREEERFQRISKQMEKAEDGEGMIRLLDKMDLPDPFHSS